MVQTYADVFKDKKVSDVVASVYMGHENATNYYVRKKKRCLENWRYYWAHDPELGLGQWDAEAVQYLLSQNRKLTQFNFIKVIVDTIEGGLAKLVFDPDVYPIGREMTSLTKALKEAMYADKEQMDWGPALQQLMKDGLIHEGVIKMIIDRRFDDLGNIALSNCAPGSTMADPNWKTNSGWDCRKCWYDTWHTDLSLMDMIPEQADYIKWQLNARNNEFVDTYGAYTGIIPYEGAGHQSGTSYKMISQYDVVDENITNEYAPVVGGDDVLIPQNIEPTKRAEWLNKFHPNWIPDLVYSKKEKIKKCYVRSIVPSITLEKELIKKPIEIQIGRLPFFWWSATRANGESDAIVDSIKDPQSMINYMESLMLNKMQTDGGGGSQFVDRSGFATTQEFERYKVNRNNPAENFETKEGLIVRDGKSPAIPTAKGAFPTEAMSLVDHMVNVILPNISKVNKAGLGQREGADQSGKLYELMKSQADQQLYTTHLGLRYLHNEIYESYFMAAVEHYSQESLPRTFTYQQGKKSITLNERIKDPVTGEIIGIKNDVSTMRGVRHKIIIGEKQQTPNEKIEKLDSIGNFIMKLGAQSPLVTKQLVGMATDLMGMMEGDDRDVMMALIDKDMELQISLTDSQIARNKLDRLTFEDQAQQLIDKKAADEKMKQEQAAGAPPPEPPPPETKPPSISISWKDLPPDAKIQVLKQAGVEIAPPEPAPEQGAIEQDQGISPSPQGDGSGQEGAPAPEMPVLSPQMIGPQA